MVVLALETVTPPGSYALARDGIIVAQMGDASVPHAARLPHVVVDWLRTQGLSLDDVTHLAVVAGPGSFTGVRIGMACVQGLAVTRGWPVASVSTLDALAEGWRVTHGEATPRTVLACLDGMRGEVFTAVYDWDGTTLRTMGEPAVGPPDRDVVGTRAGTTAAPVVVVGNGAVRYGPVWTMEGFEVLDAAEPLAASAARLALAPGRPFTSPHALHPTYVRRPDVELARDRRAAQA